MGVVIGYQQEEFNFMLSLAIEWRESSGKYVPTLESNIFVTGNVKINEQDKSIGTGSLYV